MEKRPIVLFALSMAFGIFIGRSSGSLILIASTGLAVFSISLILKGKSLKNVLILTVVMVFYMAGAVEYILVNNANEKRYQDFAGKDVTVRGTIVSEPDIREARVIYILKTDMVEGEAGVRKIEGKILLTTPLKNDTGIMGYGRKVEVRGQLNLPKGRRNPGGFDYRQYLAGSGISATIFAGDGCVRISGYGNVNPIVRIGVGIRDRLTSVINRSLPREQAALLNGMLVGYTEGLSENVRQAFSDAGLSHIMAASGMNVAFIIAPLVFIFRKLHVRQRTANLIILFIIMVFVSVAGFTPSVTRAAIMAAVVLVAQIIRREPDIYASISFAAILLLASNPYNLFNIGFQLSFAATLSLVMFYKHIGNLINFKFIPGFIKDIVSATLAAQVGIIPLTALHFNKISVISLFSNLLVVPLVQVVTILGFAMALAGQVFIAVSQVIGYVNNVFLSFILFVTKLSSRLPFAVLEVPTPSLPIIAAFYILLIYFLWYKPLYKPRVKPAIYITAVTIAAIVILLRLLPGNEMKVIFLDVGEGDSTFIRTCTGKNILIDGGGYNSKLNPGQNIGDTVVVPFLFDQGVTRMDLVIATHCHDDHIQGLFPVLRTFRTVNLVIPDNPDNSGFAPLINTAVENKVKVTACNRCDIIRLDRYTYLEVLYPPKDAAIVNSSLNDSSIVVKLHYKKSSILFTGDIESEAEEELIGSRADIRADVLKVAHHGSSNSTKIEFLEKVRPRMAVISVGKNNFGHPSPDVLARLEDFNIPVFRTDECGAVILRTDGNSMKVSRTIAKVSK